MAILDFITCFVVAGMGSMLGAALMLLVRTEQPRMSQAVALFKLSFALLSALAAVAFVPADYRAITLKTSIWFACVGVAMLCWAFRQLNGRNTHPALGALGIALVGGVMAWASGLEPHSYALVLALTFSAISIFFTIDQGWLIVTSTRLRPAEVSLLVVVMLFTVNWLITARHAYISTAPVPPHWVYAPDWLVPWSGISYALLPMAVAAVVFSVINERLMQQLRTRALSDDLTGALSRRGLRELGEQMLAMQASQPNMVAVLMIDVDHFKMVNDRYGHLAGDDVLRHMTNLIKDDLRPDALLARYGGEEFTVLLPVRAPNEALVVAERLRDVIQSHPCSTKLVQITITVSIGVSHHQPGGTLEDALQRADERLYIAKQTGRNRVVSGAD
jgi:diguanylate cyclase (GGDEF)-like protein